MSIGNFRGKKRKITVYRAVCRNLVARFLFNRPAAQRRLQPQTTYWEPVVMKRFFIRNRIAGGWEEPCYHDNRSAMFFISTSHQTAFSACKTVLLRI